MISSNTLQGRFARAELARELAAASGRPKVAELNALSGMVDTMTPLGMLSLRSTVSAPIIPPAIHGDAPAIASLGWTRTSMKLHALWL